MTSSTEPPLPARPSVRTTLEVHYFDTDAAGVVHNVAYLRLVEVARTRLAAHLGWTLTEMRQTGRVPVVARTEIDYLRPARVGDHLHLDAELLNLGRVEFVIGYTILNAAEPALVHARCRQTMVTILLPGGRPQRVPAAWRTAFPHLIQDERAKRFPGEPDVSAASAPVNRD